MDINDYFRMLRRAWVSLLALTIIGAGLGLAVATVQTPRYSATAKAYVSASSAQSLSELSQGTTFLQQVVSSYADIATTSFVLSPVIAELHLSKTPDALAKQVTVTSASSESVLEITVIDTSPARAASIANAVTARLAVAVVNLTARTGTRVSVIKFTQVDPAIPKASPVEPRPAMDLATGAFAGLILALAIAVLREFLDTRVRSVQDLERLTERPILGSTVRESPQSWSGPLVSFDSTDGPLWHRGESYRSLRTNLQFVEFDPKKRSIVITSAIEREGKSTSAANLALAVAALGERVLLVDADLRRPKVAEYFGIEGGVGLSDVLIGRATLDQALQTIGTTALSVLPAGTIPPNPNEQLQSKSMVQLIETLHARFDLVVFDTPPLLPVSDAAALTRHTGGALLVVAAGRVRRAQVAQALESLARVDARTFGIVLTMLPSRGPDAATYGSKVYAAEPAPVRRIPRLLSTVRQTLLRMPAAGWWRRTAPSRTGRPSAQQD